MADSDPSAESTNRYSPLAVVAFVLAFAFAPAGIICGHIALAQASRRGGKGHGFALSATVIGYTFLVLGIVGVLIQHL